MDALDTERTGNRLLDGLAIAEKRGILQQLTLRALTPPDVLQPAGELVSRVYFPTEGVISLTTPLSDGRHIEAAVIGNEGFLGLQALAGASPGNLRAIAQIPGAVLTMDIEAFKGLITGSSHLRWMVGAYSQAFISQLAQGAACNVAHPVVGRCARWLLESHDRVQGEEFYLTQEFLSEMLGVTRPSVSVSAGALQAAGLISYARGRMQILDRAGLESASCECYQVIRDEYRRLMSAD